MKLGLVTHYMPPHRGGIEVAALDHAIAAASRGDSVRWVSSRIPRSAPTRETTEWGEARRVAAWNPFEEWPGVPYPVWSPSARREIVDLVRWADVVHVHDALYPGTTLALRAARRVGRPVLLSQHVGLVPYSHPLLNLAQRVAYRWIGRRNGRRATAWGYCAVHARDHLARICGGSPRVYFLPNGVDTRAFRPAADASEVASLRRRFELPSGVIVLFVGRLVFKKGAHLVAAAADPAFRLILVGEGGTLQGGAGFEVRKFLPREELAALMRACDVFVLPSLGEGFPVVVQEAMASGLPVAMTRHPSYSDYLDDHHACWIEPEPDAIRAALRRLAADEGERRRLGSAGRRRAEERFALDQCRARVLRAYDDLASAA